VSMSSPRIKQSLLIIAICVSSCAMTGCVDGVYDLSNHSRLPRSMALPPGLTRKDVFVQLVFYTPRRGSDDVKLVLHDRKWKKLAEIKGNAVRPTITYTTTHRPIRTPDGTIDLVTRTPNEPREPYVHIVTDTDTAETFKMRGVPHYNIKQNGTFVALFYVIDDSDASKQVSLEDLPICPKHNKSQKGVSRDDQSGPCLVPN